MAKATRRWPGAPHGVPGIRATPCRFTISTIFACEIAEINRRGADGVISACEIARRRITRRGKTDLPVGDHVAEMERGGRRLRREVGQRAEQDVVRLRDVHVLLLDGLAEELVVADELEHRVRPVDHRVAAAHLGHDDGGHVCVVRLPLARR